MASSQQNDMKEKLLDAQKPVAVADGSLNGQAPAPTEAEKRRSRALLISFVLMIFIGLGNRIMNVLQFTPMQNYPLFVNLLTTAAYIPTSLCYVIPMAKYRPDIITPEARAVPQKVWLIMGTLDSIAGVMQTFATAYLSNAGSLIVLLMQSAIPISMVITKVFLKAKYKVYQYCGALLVIAGLLVVLVPSLVQGVTGVSDLGVWAAVLVLSCVPMCLSSVYKEKALGDTEIDAIYMNFWVAVYQFAISIPLLLPMGYAMQPQAVPIQDLPRNLWNGARCYAGFNSIFEPTNTTAHGGAMLTDSAVPADDCSLGPAFVNVYILFNLAYNVLIILMLKYGSANILWLCFTLQVPVANFAFALDFMPNHQPVSWENGIGLVIIMTGLIIYRFYNQLRAFAMKRMGYAAVPTTDRKPAGGDDPLALGDVSEASPSSMSGSTPVRGMRTHMTRAQPKGVTKKAEAVAQARARLEVPNTGKSAAGRTRGDSQ